LTFDLPLDDGAKRLTSKTLGKEHVIVFAQADPNLGDILVDENRKLSIIINWECAAWYSEYWEYTKMHFGVRSRTRWIHDVVRQISVRYRDELEAENILVSMPP
jgi:hypothetical protein